jgi:hypothetical protein
MIEKRLQRRSRDNQRHKLKLRTVARCGPSGELLAIEAAVSRRALKSDTDQGVEFCGRNEAEEMEPHPHLQQSRSASYSENIRKTKKTE